MNLKGPLFPIHEASPSHSYDKSEPLGFGLLTEVHLDHGVSMGETFFDVQPYFPCYALFLDSSNALVLKQTGNPQGEYTRIGIAKFLRTQKQRLENPMPSVASVSSLYIDGGESVFSKVPWGPITDSDARLLVTVV